jgi:hypothetical protein
MKRRTKRQAARAQSRAQKEAGMKAPGGASKYAKKRAWLMKNGMFGFDVPNPKPWK